MTDQLELVHFGAFSGTATQVRNALAARVQVRDFDAQRIARSKVMPYVRIRAELEAARHGHTWVKTKAWSAGLQRRLERAGACSGRAPVVVLGTIPALVLDPCVRYVVYADRVGAETLDALPPYRQTATLGWLEREALFIRRADAIFTLGPTTARAVEERYAVPADRIEVVGSGPNTALSPPRSTRPLRRLLFCGVDWSRKGGPEALAAFERVRDDHPRLELWIVGVSLSQTLPEGVRCLGRVPHARMDDVLSQVDALLVPTKDEPFGVIFVEAILKGLPVVATDIGNIRWITGAAGILASPDDPSSLEGSLRELCEHYGQYRDRALARRLKVEPLMRYDVVAERILAAL